MAAQTLRKSICVSKKSCATRQVGHTLEHRIDHLERLIDLLAHLRASQDDFTAHKDQEHDLRLDHSVDETWEQFWLVRAEHVMTASKTFKTDGESDIT